MYSFRNDYSEGAHPRILESLTKTNEIQTVGYGMDEYCESAKNLIKKQLEDDTPDIHFLVGGTSTNQIVISSILKPYQAVICADTGHINVHETGAIEATGHKVIGVPAVDGKLTIDAISKVLNEHNGEHMVQPKMVYISNSTEVGTVYLRQELQALHRFCRKNGLYLFLDGARLGSALRSSDNNMTLPDIAALTDVFYIGGTKNGALFGEAIVIMREELKQDFRYHIKQRGAMLAKGRLLGLQFAALFQDNLYFELADHANAMAAKLKNGIASLGYTFLNEGNTNQLFPVFPDTVVDKLQEEFGFEYERRMDESHSCIRLVTSWATKEEGVNLFLSALEKCSC